MAEIAIFVVGCSAVGVGFNRNAMKLDKNTWVLAVAQVAGWLLLWLIPVMIALFTEMSLDAAREILKSSTRFVFWYGSFYFINFYVLIPYLLFRRRKGWFFVCNLLITIFQMATVLMALSANAGPEWRVGIYMIGFGIFFSDALVVSAPVAIRYALRWNEMRIAFQEEKRKHADAELAWLKNQLNPHFLFNTLNNISSLVQIDADSAQDSIGQLSDLLRYALYDSNRDRVPLDSEVEFMTNYIDLMRLRCNSLTTVDTRFDAPPHPVQIAPLLFISVIENAFKHGVNSRKHSFVRIRLSWEADNLVFTAENSNDPKHDTDRSGSGIGVENLHRRLELLYPGRYRYAQWLENDTYSVRITLLNM